MNSRKQFNINKELYTELDLYCFTENINYFNFNLDLDFNLLLRTMKCGCILPLFHLQMDVNYIWSQSTSVTWAKMQELCLLLVR